MPRDEMGNEIPEQVEGESTPPEQPPVTPTEAPKAATAKATASIMVSMPIELKNIVDARAGESELGAAAWVRQMIANTVGYTLTTATRTRAPSEKYTVTAQDGSKRAMTKEEKAEAIKAQTKKDKDTLKAVLAAARAGKLNLDDLITQFGATPTPAPVTTPSA